MAFTAILLFSIYTSCCLAELVDSSKNKNRYQASWDDLDNPDLEDPNYDDLKQSKDPDYDKLDPWNSLDNGSYNNSDNSLSNFNKLVRSYKAICYKDVRL